MCNIIIRSMNSLYAIMNDYLISVPHTSVRSLSRAVNYKYRFNHKGQGSFSNASKRMANIGSCRRGMQPLRDFTMRPMVTLKQLQSRGEN
jgi:hypothetical protein